jgi:putative methyltransferase
MWNQRLSLAVAQEVKRLHPNATIIAGGPSVPVAAEGFLIQHPYLDFLVHGEGEVAFLDLCLERVRRNVLDKVPGLSFR